MEVLEPDHHHVSSKRDKVRVSSLLWLWLCVCVQWGVSPVVPRGAPVQHRLVGPSAVDRLSQTWSPALPPVAEGGAEDHRTLVTTGDQEPQSGLSQNHSLSNCFQKFCQGKYIFGVCQCVSVVKAGGILVGTQLLSKWG